MKKLIKKESYLKNKLPIKIRKSMVEVSDFLLHQRAEYSVLKHQVHSLPESLDRGILESKLFKFLAKIEFAEDKLKELAFDATVVYNNILTKSKK